MQELGFIMWTVFVMACSYGLGRLDRAAKRHAAHNEAKAIGELSGYSRARKDYRAAAILKEHADGRHDETLDGKHENH